MRANYSGKAYWLNIMRLIMKENVLVFLCIVQIIMGANVFTGGIDRWQIYSTCLRFKKNVDEPPFNAKLLNET